MADDLTSRLGLPLYDSGSSPHPTRVDFNDRMAVLDEAVAVARQGTRAQREAILPNTRGTLFLETDTRILWWDTGNEWVRVYRLGLQGPGRPLNIGSSTGTEGTSEYAARTDHTHPLPLATRTQAGGMSAADKAKLDDATSTWGNQGGTLVRRDSQSRFRAQNPDNAYDVANKRWVESLTSNMLDTGERIRSGNLNTVSPNKVHTVWSSDLANVSNTPPQINTSMVTITVEDQGLYKTQLAFSQFAPYRFCYRKQNSSGWSDWLELVTTEHSAIQDVLAATFNDEGGTLVRRHSNGTFRVADPNNSFQATNRGWVENQLAAYSPPARRITSGNLNNHTDFAVISIYGSNLGDVSNTPSNARNSITVHVTPGPNNFVTQVAYEQLNDSPRQWYRTRTASTWGNWMQVATGGGERIDEGDLNDYRDNGDYYIIWPNNNRVLNTPDASNSLMVSVTSTANSFVRQDATNAFSGAHWWRTYPRSTEGWTPWFRTATA